ncbi:MAG TPA: hypothetical protein VF801_11110 [Rhodocyclaceae bacterium]
MSNTRRGMTIGATLEKLSQQTGIVVNRNPHATGIPGKQGSQRKEVHDRGNQQAINAVKQKIKQETGKPNLFQSSMVRTMEKQEKQKAPKPELTGKELALEQLSKRYKTVAKPFDPFKDGNPNRPTKRE